LRMPTGSRTRGWKARPYRPLEDSLLIRERLRNGGSWSRFVGEAIGRWPIAIASADVVVLGTLAHGLDADGAPAAVGIGLWVVAERIKMREVVTDGSESALLIAPAVGEIRFAAGGRAHALKNNCGHGLQPCFAGADHIDRDADGLG